MSDTQDLVHTCEHYFHLLDMEPYLCGSVATILHEGMWFCSAHKPVPVEPTQRPLQFYHMQKLAEALLPHEPISSIEKKAVRAWSFSTMMEEMQRRFNAEWSIVRIKGLTYMAQGDEAAFSVIILLAGKEYPRRFSHPIAELHEKPMSQALLFLRHALDREVNAIRAQLQLAQKNEEQRRLAIEANNSVITNPMEIVDTRVVEIGEKIMPISTPLRAITDENRASFLVALYGAAKPQGLGHLHYVPGPLPIEEARVVLERSKYVDYLKGRVIKVDFGVPYPRWDLYDRDNGSGAAQRVLLQAGLYYA